MQKKMDIILHPVRLRIIQYAAHQPALTVAQIAQALPDISKATLYRHVRVLLENEILTVVGQEKRRGTLERRYALNLEKVAAPEMGHIADAQGLVYTLLMKLLEDFKRYFRGERANPVADRLFVATNTLSLPDDCFEAFVEELYAVVEKYSQIESEPNGKERMITLVSSPAFPENEKEKP